jgi:hypothetical protein
MRHPKAVRTSRTETNKDLRLNLRGIVVACLVFRVTNRVRVERGTGNVDGRSQECSELGFEEDDDEPEDDLEDDDPEDDDPEDDDPEEDDPEGHDGDPVASNGDPRSDQAHDQPVVPADSDESPLLCSGRSRSGRFGSGGGGGKVNPYESTVV